MMGGGLQLYAYRVGACDLADALTLGFAGFPLRAGRAISNEKAAPEDLGRRFVCWPLVRLVIT